MRPSSSVSSVSTAPVSSSIATPLAASSATRCTRSESSSLRSDRLRLSCAKPTNHATTNPMSRSNTAVPTSSTSSIFSDWYGCVKKKSNENVDTTAAVTPEPAPPAAAARTTTSTKTSATFADTMDSSWNGTSTPATRSGPKPAMTSPSTLSVSSGTYRCCLLRRILAVYLLGDTRESVFARFVTRPWTTLTCRSRGLVPRSSAGVSRGNAAAVCPFRALGSRLR